METKELIKALGFLPKNNATAIFQKKYKDYAIEVDFEKNQFNFGGKIKFGDSEKTTQNIVKPEDWVVFECVDRLLEKGYQPQNIALEKTWKTGHGTSGRLDILVARDNGDAYLMIECKTWGTEFEKEFKNLKKNGGQLFTYFQQDKNADILMLYSSELDGDKVNYQNEIVKIEEDYRQTANVKDFFERWNKLPKTNGVFDNWASLYEFQSKALTKKDLKVLKQEDSSFIFNRFLEILRHNVVSDKPNAFNKIFTLFLCKIVDEYSKDEDDELEFQWIEGKDDHISFQKRLTDLYNKGMKELLEKDVTDVSDEELDKRFASIDEKYQEEFKHILTEIRLKKNNEFAIKEVYDDASFYENAKVVKEVVELLQVYKIRYNYRQQFLSDFFELLLTTGLKQESGQFFTPVPIARFIIKSLPFQEIAQQKIEKGNKKDLLPTIIDYAAGSGHFLTEAMEEVQKYIDKLNLKDYKSETRKYLDGFQRVQFDWAEDYVYGIEKDYRLVKTAKVSCYLHGDGLAKVIHGDGLGDFKTSTEFKDLLKETDKIYPQDNKQFDIVISNPPYSVSAFKGLMNDEKASKAFDLYNRLTDQSSEIECLFIERTKQLLKDGGVAGIILPSSILSNTGLYTETRELILKYFDILAIAEMGSNTFMATGTNTVTLFLQRRNNADWLNIQASVSKAFTNLQDININGIEKPVSKYLTQVWEAISFNDYKSLLQKTPNDKVRNHEIYQEYDKKIKAKNQTEKLDKILAIEAEKLLYFIIALPQKIVLVKTGSKKEEKRFLGYEFSNRRGSEGIHPVQRSKSIDECTQLYDADTFTNPQKASTYIYKAFAEHKFDLEIPESLQKNISYQHLTDLMTFDRIDFEKNISLAVKKKVKFELIWNTSKLKFLSEVAHIQKGKTITEAKTVKGNIPVIAGGKLPAYYHNKSNRKGNVITVSASGAYSGFVNYFDKPIFASDCNTIISKIENVISTKLIFYFLKSIQQIVYGLQRGQAQPHVYADDLSKIKIPLPPKDIQEKIVAAIEELEKEEAKAVEMIKKLKEDIYNFYSTNEGGKKRLDEICEMKAGKFVKADNIYNDYNENLFPCYGGNGLRGYTETYTNEGMYSLVGRQGALCGNVHLVSGKFHATEHALVVYPNKNVNTVWLHYKLVFMNLNQYATGTAQPGLSVMNLNPIEIPVPPISEQKKIVSQIEKIENKITELKKKINTIPQQKEAILKQYLE